MSQHTSRKATQQKRIDRLEQRAGICICQPPVIAFYSNDAEARAGEKLPKQKCRIQGHTGPSYTAIGIYLDPCDCGECPACLGTPMTAAELEETRKHVASRRGSAESARDYDPSPALPEKSNRLENLAGATHEAVQARSPSPMLEAQPEAPRAPEPGSAIVTGPSRDASWTLGGDHRCVCSHPQRLHGPDNRCRIVLQGWTGRGPCGCRGYEASPALQPTAHIPRFVSTWGGDCECGHMMQQHTEYPTTKCAVVMTLGQLGGPCACQEYRPKAGA